jgi:hypothetical protein
MIRIPAILVSAAVAASGVVSSASAQTFSTSMGTGNLQATHYDGQSHLVTELASQNRGGQPANAAAPAKQTPTATRATRSGHSAYAAAPANRIPTTTGSGSAGYNELLMSH